METHMPIMDNVGRIVGNLLGRLLKLGMMGFGARIWVYTKGLCPPKEFGL